MEIHEIPNIDIIISALYLKISDDKKELTKLTYKKIFSLINIKTSQRLLNEISHLTHKEDNFKIQGILRAKKQQKHVDPIATFRLINLIQIGSLESYAFYHIIRANDFKKDIYLSLGKFNEADSNIDKSSFRKSDDIYNFIVQNIPQNQYQILSITEAKILTESIKDEFYYKQEYHEGEIIEIAYSMYQIDSSHDNKYNGVSIYWGTNRASSYYPGGIYFTDDRNNKVSTNEQLNVGRSLVTIPDIHRKGEIERPAKWWKFWRKRTEDINQHLVIHSIDLMDRDKWCSKLFNKKDESEGMLFIHGYNCSFEDAIYRTAQLKYDLKFTGLTFCFSWASSGKVISYPADESTIGWSVTHLEEFIELITKEINLSKLHIIAHSMGNRALIDVIKKWNGKQKKVHTIVLAAPDVDADTMKNTAAYFSGFNNVTLYSSTKDIPVNFSNTLHKYTRAGNSNPPLVLDYTDTIDVSKINKPIFSLGHSYFADAFEVFNDLYYLINEKIPAPSRNGITYKDIWKCYILT